MPSIEEKIKATKSLLFYGNLTTVWVALGTAACWLVSPSLGWLFLGFSAFTILIMLRRQMCSSCYYCKSCTKGFAKLSKLFLGGTRIPGIGRGSTFGMTGFIYVLLSVLPSILLVSSMSQEFSQMKLFLLVCLLAISTHNGITRRKGCYN